MPPPKTDEEHRAFVVRELRTFADLVETEKEPRSLLKPLTVARRALNRFEMHLEAEAKVPVGFVCLHCGEAYHEDYMVHDHIWREAVPDVSARYAELETRGLPKHGLYLHIRCLEARLGRPVTVDDLKPAPCNDAIRYFAR